MSTQNETEDELQICLKAILKSLKITKKHIFFKSNMLQINNYMGVLQEIEIYGNDQDDNAVTLDLIAKSAPKALNYRDFMGTKRCFEREIYMYTNVLPEFIKLQNENDIQQEFTSFPKFYTSSNKYLNELVIMENMKSYKTCDARGSFNYNQALLVVKELGRLHALSFALQEQNPTLFVKLCNNVRDNEYNIEGYTTVRIIMENCVKYALNLFDPISDKVAFEKLNELGGHVSDLLKNVTSGSAADHLVIGHGDCWVANVLFRSSEFESPSDVCFVDWQVSRACSPALDLSQLLFVCCEKPLRDRYYRHLIEEYYKSFSSFLRQFGCVPEQLFPFDVLKTHLKKFSILALCTAFRMLWFVSATSDNIPPVFEFNNIGECFDSYEKFERSVEVYNNRVRDTVMDYIEYGFDL